MRKFAKFAEKTALCLLWIYRKCISPWTPDSCRFIPTCSSYAGEAVKTFGVCKGGWLALKRVLRCHPFYRGSLHDPVPQVKVDADNISNKSGAGINNE
ncbi:MAG: membrane protein insertion efficiency factor YidD [Lentisphaeria bacterium]